MAFISYAHEDEVAARKLYSDLKNSGANPWLDKECLIPGQKWEIAIKQAIKNSDFFLAVLSSTSEEKRGYVQKEISQALDILDEFPESRIFLIPIRLDECKPSHEKLKDLHWADMFPIWDKGLEKIISVLNGTSSGKIIGQEQIPLRVPKKSNPESTSIDIPQNDSGLIEVEIPENSHAYKTKICEARIMQKNNPPSTEPPLKIKLSEMANPAHKSSIGDIQVERYEKLKNKFSKFIKKLDIEWTIEKDSCPVNINEGKAILRKGYSELLEFRTQVDDSARSELSANLSNILVELKIIMNHQVYIDGGKSYSEFWRKGDAIIIKLKRIEY
jgi:hypothetical protein